MLNGRPLTQFEEQETIPFDESDLPLENRPVKLEQPIKDQSIDVNYVDEWFNKILDAMRTLYGAVIELGKKIDNLPQRPQKALTNDISGGKLCPVHNTELVHKSGVSKTTGKPYSFWACPMKNPDGSFCTTKA